MSHNGTIDATRQMLEQPRLDALAKLEESLNVKLDDRLKRFLIDRLVAQQINALCWKVGESCKKTSDSSALEAIKHYTEECLGNHREMENMVNDYQATVNGLKAMTASRVSASTTASTWAGEDRRSRVLRPHAPAGNLN